MNHIPVMLPDVVRLMAPHAGGVYLDGTFGGGGYAAALLEAAPCSVWAIDRDPDAIARGAALAARFSGRLHLIQGQFGDMLALLAESGVTALDGVMLDLGVSSFQLDDPARGFSFRADGPLDMRMSRTGRTAADLVNTLSERELAGIDPATRSFQALRISVNDELGEVARALAQASELLAPGGRLVVVSFHSLEDRLVKRFMTEAAGRAPAPSRHDLRGLAARPAPHFRLLTARPLRPEAAETKANARARSARLRAMERLAA
jgi:16S rRNA (cytosine1402-N4)-methyltransferase